MRVKKENVENGVPHEVVAFQRGVVFLGGAILMLTLIGWMVRSGEVATASASGLDDVEAVEGLAEGDFFQDEERPSETLRHRFAGNTTGDLRAALAHGSSSELVLLETFGDEKNFYDLMSAIETRDIDHGIVLFRGDDTEAGRRNYRVSVGGVLRAQLEVEKIDGNWFVVRCHEVDDDDDDDDDGAHVLRNHRTNRS